MEQVVSTYKDISDLQSSLKYWNKRGYKLSNIFWQSKENIVGSQYSIKTYSDYSIVAIYDKVEKDKSE